MSRVVGVTGTNGLSGKHVVITGGSQGLGLAMLKALVKCGAKVTAIARNRGKLVQAERAGASIIVGDTTNATLINDVVDQQKPAVLILNAGAQLPLKPIDRLSWDEFSTNWNSDVNAGLAGMQAALNTPMDPGSRVLVMSSGAAMVLGVPFIEPESLRRSGGYIGAKRMLWYMAHCANAVSRERQLGVHFQVLVPCQLIPDTPLGHHVAATYAAIEGVSIEEYVMQRYGSLLPSDEFGERVAELLLDPRYAGGVAYGVRANAEIMPLDL